MGFLDVAWNDKSHRRLLLRQAMKCAQSPNQFAAINPDNAAIRETFAKDRQCSVIGRVGERWHQHAGVCDVEVRIRSRQP